MSFGACASARSIAARSAGRASFKIVENAARQPWGVVPALQAGPGVELDQGILAQGRPAPPREDAAGFVQIRIERMHICMVVMHARCAQHCHRCGRERDQVIVAGVGLPGPGELHPLSRDPPRRRRPVQILDLIPARTAHRGPANGGQRQETRR